MVAVLAGLLAWQLESDNAVAAPDGLPVDDAIRATPRWRKPTGADFPRPFVPGLALYIPVWHFIKVRQNISGFWIEIEPVEVLVLYGAVGWLLQYGMVYVSPYILL